MLAWMLAICSLPGWAQVNYHIEITEPEHHLARITLTLPTSPAGEVVLQLPNWRTGRYQLLPMADGIRRFQAEDGEGRTLAWRKSDRASWTVSRSEPGALKIQYQVHANELGDRSRHIDDSHAYLNASGVLMYAEPWRDSEAVVSLSVPESWRSDSGLKRLGAHRFQAADYDVLVDSPIETGLHQHFEFHVDGRDYRVLFWGEGNYDAGKIVEDLKALAATGGRYFGREYPFESYLFIIHATDGVRGATEYRNSTVIQRPRWRFASREDHLSLMSTAAHELVHTWNVKAYRPRGLVPYDYQNDNYSRLLWFAEGGTSYLENFWLLQAGVMTHEEFLSRLAERIQRFMARPGVSEQSVAEASFDNWIARGGDYGNNHSVSIYSEGFMASWALDLWLTKGGSSLQALHQALYRQHALPESYGEADLRRLMQLLTGRSAESWWRQNVEAPLLLPIDAWLEQLGLSLVWPEAREWDPGWQLGEEGADLLTGVRRGSAAWEAGLTPGDRLVAIEGLRWQPGDWAARLGDPEPDQSVTVTLFRRERLITRELPWRVQPKGAPSLAPLASTTATQRAAFARWTGTPWPFDSEPGK
ncbi:PDZ domain-containing protein [Ferrimonas gelatinilytica]|uniref:PDZ domain-containing protein n=1 Tax=Ferrimonas gelatinilytica TaxID=1255257 RepID=A0ABP9RTX8_9GAMM